MTEIVAIVSDMHINSTVGLSIPSINLDDGGTHSTSRGQRWLWDCWLDFWNSVDECARKNAADVTTILNGDIVEGDAKHRSSQVATTNPATILRMAFETIEPAVNLSKRMFFIRGTGAHTGKSAHMEEELASDTLGAVMCEETNTYSWWRLLAEFSGVLMDVTHHGPLGRKPWTGTNPLNALAVELAMAYTGRRLPDIALRSHNHHAGDTYDNFPVRVVALPSWQLSTEYVHRIGAQPSDVGGIMVICDRGHYEIVKKTYKPAPQKIWTSQTPTF